MITPAYLKPGDRVGIVSTARKIDLEQIADGLALIKSWGLVPVIGKTIGAQEDQYAGSDYFRQDDLQHMLEDPTIKAVWCAKGGYGTVRIIDNIDFHHFLENPKWIVGYSDVTVLHSHIHNLGVETLHGIMPYHIDDNSAFAKTSLRKSLFGEKISYHIEDAPLNRNGKASGAVVGGNISILYSLCGSPSAINTEGKILFLEDLDEYLYHIDRMLVNLKRNGMLSNLAGLIVGGLTKMHDNSVPFGKTAAEIIWDAVKDFEYPVCFDFPAGHLDDNRTLILGREADLIVSEKGVDLIFEEI